MLIVNSLHSCRSIHEGTGKAKGRAIAIALQDAERTALTALIHKWTCPDFVER